MQRRRILLAGVAGASVLSPPLRAQASRWPQRPVTIVCMFPAGGVADAVARTVAAELALSLGQPFVVENRAGANGQLAAEHVARSAPDGYTLFLASDAAISLNPLVYSRLRYDPARDFVPITQLARGIKALLVAASLPVADVAQLVAHARAHPGKYNYASFGIGSNPHLDAEMFKVLTRTDLVHVPYKGVAEAVPALASDQVHLLFSALGQALPQIRAGRVKALAVFTAQRQAAAPETPTAAEQGLGEIPAGAWFGLMAPAGTPQEIVTLLAREAVRAAQLETFRTRILEGMGMERVANTPAEFAAALGQERARYAAMVRAAKLRPEPN